jgi:uncharacterized repeat protein (TIGR01451 family)
MKLTQSTQLCAVALISLALAAPKARAFWAPNGPELPNFDKRAIGADGAAVVERAAAQNTLGARVPGLQVYFDEHTGAPKWITAGSGFLSGPGASGLAISQQTAALYGTNDNYRATKAFIQEHQSLFGFGPEILSTARVTQDSVTAHNGLRTVVWAQDLDGIPLFQTLLISHTTKREELVNLSSQFIPNPSQAADNGTPNRTAVLQNPQISAVSAVNAALVDLGETVEPSSITAVEPQSSGAEQRRHFTAPPLNDQADVKLVWLPMNATSLRLCWDIVMTSRARSEMYRSLVDVQTGEVLVRHRLTEYLSDVSYRIYPSDSPSPFSPGCPTPCTTQPPIVSRVLVTLPALDTTASPAGWIDDGGNETRGNNVDAHTDRDGNNVPELPRPQGSPFRTFDFTLDLTQAPAVYTNAAVVELFYWNNWMHDKLYQLGFTEAARNFQSNNFGRGGLGNDAVQADAQDGSGVNNANFSTPSDGSAGRMQMFIFTGPTPDRDGDLDHEVVLHEYTHGLSNRRVGGGVGISALQPRGMGEGWSDWYSLSLLSEPGDDPNAAYAEGGYVTYQLSGMTSNYYFGIRRYPYCTDMTKNPLTFKDIDPNQASTHPGIPRSGIVGTQADEVHNQGEVWCVTLWEARAKLITKYGYSVGNQLALKLVTDGMNLSVANPTFLQARDGILQADNVDNGGADLAELWTAFAKRGMGFGATSPASSTTIGVVESYVVPLVSMTLTVPHNVTEGDPPVLGQITVGSAPATNVTLNISNSAPSQVSVPPTVTLLAGQTTTNFAITIIDDALLDGPQAATISASAAGFATGSDTMLVADNETAILSLSLPAATTEGVGSVLGTISASAAPASNITVNLSSSDTTALQVPASVVLPAGQTSVGFSATIVDDTKIDGDQSATITAHVPNWTDAVAIVVVHDNETTNLVVTLPATAREGDGTLLNAGTVRISGTLTTNLTVSLLSSDTTELTVPPTMTILAGQTSGTFSPTVIDDTEVDGPQTVTVTASAFGFSDGATNMIVNDNESPPIPFNPSPAHLATNVIQTTGLAWSSGAVPGEIITNDVYFGTNPTPGPAEFQGTTLGTTWTLPNLLPLTTYYWQIVARKTGVVPGPVWQFTTRGPDHFVWNPIGSQYVNQPFTATVTAKDIFETTVSNFTGTVAFSATGGGLGEVFRANFESGLQGFTVTNTFGLGNGLWHLSTGRGNQAGHSPISSIYYGQGEGPTGGGTYNTPGLANEGIIVSPVIDLTGVNGPLTLSFNCLIQSEPGTSWDHGTVEVSTNNFASFVVLASNNQGGTVFGTDSLGNWITVTNDFSIFAGRQVRIRFHFNTIDSGANLFEGWYVDDIVITGSGSSPGLSPTNSTPFNNGVWSGLLTVQSPSSNVVVRADDGNGHTGSSNPFAVQLQNDISVSVSDAPDPVSLGGNLTYNIVVANTGPSSATGVVVTNLLPPSGSLISVTPSQGTFTTNGNTVVCNVGTIAGSASATISIVVSPIAVGTMTNQTTVTRAEADAYLPNNTAVVTTAVQTPSIAINDVTLYEGNSGTTNAVFTVSVSPPPALPVSVNYNTSDGSAVAPGDYISTNGVLNFAPGETNKSVVVRVVGDTLYELNETFNVNLSSPSNASFSDSLGLGTILNDDPIPTISIGDATLAEGNVGTTSAVFGVTLSAPCGLLVTVSYTTANGTATAGSDYLATSGSLSIPPGVTSTNISVIVNGDLAIEPDEVFYVDLSFPANANLLKREGYGLILNDDGLPGQLDHFVWSAIGPTQYIGTPFIATVTAADTFNNPASAFNGTANLTGSVGGGTSTGYILGNIVSTSSSSGGYTLGYSFTPNTNLTVTHVRAYFGTKVSIWTDAGALLASQTVSGTVGSWTETQLPVPLVLNAGTTYRVAAYTGGGSYYLRSDSLNTFTNGVINVSYEGVGDVFPVNSDSARWWFVDLRFSAGSSLPSSIAPSVAGPFTNGVWTGNITALLPATNFVIRADDGNAHSGLSNPFNVELRNDLSLTVSDSPDPVVIGGYLTNFVTVTNSGPAAATAVTVTNFIPASASFVSATASQGTSSLVAGHVECALGSIAGGSFATIAIVTTPNSGGLITNLFSAGRGEIDPYPPNNSTSSVTTVITPAVTIADAMVLEGDSGQTNLSFAVRLSFPTTLPISVNYATADFTAQAGSDYIATNGTVTFTYPETNKLITVIVKGDTNVEASESFFVNLSAPLNASLARSQAIGTIVNDDGCGLQTNYVSSQTIANVLSPTVMTMAFDGASYWACAGSPPTGIRLARYDILGNVQATYSPGLDFRSVFTDASGNLYGRTYASSIIYRQTTPGVFSNYLTLASGPLNAQSSVVLNGNGTEFIAMSGGVVSRWLTDGTFLGTVNLVGFGALSGENIAPQNGVIAALGAYWATYNGNGLVSFWDTGGNRIWQSTLLGIGGSANSGYTFSYCNGKVFVMDTSIGNWFGYDACGTAPPTAPVIYVQPASQGVSLGGLATFSVLAGGTPSLAYQWRKDTIAIPGATTSSYAIAGVQSNHVGLYSVQVTNLYGSVLSSNAALNLIIVPTNTLAQGNLRVTLNPDAAGITSVTFQSNEVYQIGTFISDWGLQTGTNAASFLRNANGVTPSISMTRISGDARSSTFTGTYTAGGANVAITRDYVLLLGADICRTRTTFLNNGGASVALRCFETYDVDWIFNGAAYYTTANDRYTIDTNGASIFVGRSLMTNGPLVVILASVDPSAIIAATSPDYFGITSSANLNRLFETLGADDNGVLRDATLDIGRDYVLPPANTATFTTYQSFGTNIASAEWGLVGNLATMPLRFSSPQRVAGGTLQFLLATTDGSPITPERASHIQLYSSTKSSLSFSNWVPIASQMLLNNGVIQINGLDYTNAPARYYRAVELP